MYFQVHTAKITSNFANTITFACLFPKACRKNQRITPGRGIKAGMLCDFRVPIFNHRSIRLTQIFFFLPHL